MPEPLQLSPEEIAAYEQAAAQPQPAAPINPIRDLSADDLFSLATQDKDGFDLVNEFRRNRDLWGDQSIVQKVADVNDRIKQRGFQLSDIPGPGKIAHTAFDIAKGFGKQAWNYANALIGVPIASAIGEVTGAAKQPGFNTELAQEGQRRVMENLAGTESATFGLARMGEKALNKVKKSALAYSGVDENPTPDQKVNNLWSDVGVGDIAEDITKGKGAALTPIGANVRQELESAGKPVRPEEVQSLAAGDPLSFYTFGKAFQGIGKGASQILPEGVSKAVEATAEKLPTAEKIAGKAVEATGNLVDLGGRAVKIAGPTVGFVKGAMTGGPIAALAGLKGGEIAAKLGNKVSKIGEGIKSVGKEVAGETPVTSATAQFAKDVANSVPDAAAEVGKGLAFDIGTAAATSESPQDTQSVGIGAFFGGMNAAKRAGGRVISGQIVAPREWGVDKYVPPSGKMDTSFENMNIAATKDAPPAVKVRLNAIRQFLKGSHADTDVFLAKDPQTLENVLKQNGVNDQQAKTLSQQEGFFTANIRGKDGTPRRVIIARDIDAAPHEAFHAIQDVLGEDANQHIDQMVREAYGPQWEQEGQRYADRIQPGGDWRETILDATGTGLNYAKEKIAMAVGNEYRNVTGAEPTPEYVQTRTKEILGQRMDQAVQANPGIDPNQIAQHVWRDILSPQEATAVADSYLSRELAAENFDMVFKNLSTALQNPGLPGRLARVVANLVSNLGGEPLSPEVTSQIGGIAPKFKVAEAVRLAPHLVQSKEGSPKPEILPVSKPKGPSELLLPSPKLNEPIKPSEGKPTETEPSQEASEIAAEAPTTPVANGTASPRELLGTIAQAIAQRAGVKINYLSAPEEPAAATTSNRDVRRQMIETFRTMPPEARSLWEKTFFPEKVLKLKGDKYQVLGWAPEVFAANAHKLAAKLVELGVADASPYPIENGTFTPDGWQELYKDAQKFVQNQIGGRTGAGEPLVVPKGLPGMFAPPEKGQPVALDQMKADFINMLFNFRLPDTARVQKGKLPLNIAGQEISEATKPGRTSIPIIPRGKFEGVEAERQGIAGREIKEVNPLRQQIEAAAQAKGVAMPEFIEAVQRLNLENIKDVQVAPEVPEFRGNTLTLSAGFQPQTAAGKELEKTGVRLEPFGYFGTRGIRALVGDKVIADISSAGTGMNKADVDMVWVADQYQKRGIAETLYRELATQLQKDGVELIGGTVIHPAPLKIREKLFGTPNIGREVTVGGKRIFQDVENFLNPETQFQPPKSSKEAEDLVKTVSAMSPKEFEQWAHSTPGGLTEAAYETGLNAPSQAFVNSLKAAEQAFAKKAIDSITSNPEEGMILAAQQQFFNEAWQAATGEGSAGYALRKEKPGYKPKFPLNVNKPETILHNKVLDSASEVSDNEANMSTQLQPKTAKKEFKMKPAKQGFSKAWILPDGTPVQLGGQWHHDYINENAALRKKYDLPADENTEQNRVEALKQGFVRINWADASGRLTVEAREKDWAKQREAVRSFVERNADKIDYIKVYLFNDNVSKIADQAEAKTFDAEDIEKSALIPFLDLDTKRATGDASDRLFQKAVEQASAPKTGVPKLSPKDGEAYWIDASGNPIAAPDGHEMKAYELNRDGIVNLDLDKLAKEMDRDGVEALYKELGKHKFLRAYNVGKTEFSVEGPGKWEHLPRAQRERLEDVAIENKRKLYYNNKPVEATEVPEVGASAFQPSKDVQDVAEEYATRAGISYKPSKERAEVPKDTAKEVADFFEAAKHNPDDPEVKKSYDMLTKETIAQYHAITEAGYTIEPWTKEGEPYKSSADMLKDVNENKHLYFKTTEGNFGVSEADRARENHMLKDSGIEIDGRPLLVNDVFRAVHDFFGHAKEGNQFGPKGEFNAWKDHSEMYSPDAQGALAAETLAQNFWVNYGKHLRNAEGNIPQRGEKGFVPLPERPFAEQKNTVVPEDLLDKVRRQPRRDFEKEGFTAKKNAGKWGWDIFNPQGEKVDEVYNTALPFGIHNQKDALRAYSAKKQPITSEELNSDIVPEYEDVIGRPSHSRYHLQPRRDFEKEGFTAKKNAGKWGWDIFNPQGEKVDEVYNTALPFGIHNQKDALRAYSAKKQPITSEELNSDIVPEYEDVIGRPSHSRYHLQPRRADEDLFGGRQNYSKSEVSKMTRAELKEAFPEAVVPKSKDDSIPSDITGSPLFKRAGTEEAAVKAFADGLVKFARSQKSDPIFKAGVSWYDEFTPMLKKEFGENADLFAELLAATSPQTSVETNFAYAVDAIESLKAGRFKKIISKFNEGLEKIADGSWEKWYNKELPNIPEPPKNPTPAAFLEHWIFKHDLKPRQTNGKLYGIHSLPVLQVFARKWLTDARGPKTLNFVENLLGKGEEATIDLWADRTMRRIGYEGQDRWRILPKNIAPVSDKDFAFSQKAFRAAADRLGMKPSALQAALWFAEKKLWAENGWSPLDLGDFRNEMQKLPMMRQGFQSRLTSEKKSAKVRPAEALELGLIQPR